MGHWRPLQILQIAPRDKLNRCDQYKKSDKFPVKWCPVHNGAWQISISKGLPNNIKGFPKISCQDEICPECKGEKTKPKKLRKEYHKLRWKNKKVNK